MSKHQDQIIAAAKGKFDEEILGAAWGKLRGALTGGAIVSEVGAGEHPTGAVAARIKIGNPVAVAVTPTSLVTMKVKLSAMGSVKAITDVLSVVPLDEVESLEVRRRGLMCVMKITARGGSFKLEGKPGDLKGLAEDFRRTKAGVVSAN